MADSLSGLFSEVEAFVKDVNLKISQGVRARAYPVANELRNASQLVLRGRRSGRRYRVPGTYSRRRHRDKTTGRMVHGRYYTASAPGEPPAVRTGAFRNSWQAKTETHLGTNNKVSTRPYIQSRVRTDNGKYILGEVLENGTGKMAPRPYKEKIQQKALPHIRRIYKAPYF